MTSSLEQPTRLPRWASAPNYTFNPVYTPEQLVKSSDLEGDELVGEIVTNQLYEIIKERES